jgi:glycosyltransferase involved in cell wall biosynthesis
VAVGTVAVIVPTYNRRKYLLQAVASVLGQTRADLVCIVVDNGSTDGTAEALEAINDPRLTRVSHDRPLGPAGARNIGIGAAEGAPWVAFLDDDDIWAPTKLERQLAAIEAHPGAGWSATAIANVTSKLDLNYVRRVFEGALLGPEGTLVEGDDLAKLMHQDANVTNAGSCLLVSGAALAAAGGFDAELTFGEDWDMLLRLSAASGLAYVDLPLVAYRIWEGQVSVNWEAEAEGNAIVRARYYPDEVVVTREYKAHWQLHGATLNVAAGKRWRAAECYARAAWFGRQPGQLAYAVAAAVQPSLVKSRLARLNLASRPDAVPESWRPELEQWLAPYRDPA